MDNILLTTLIIIILAVVGGLVWLVQEHKNLRKDNKILSDSIERNSRDIAGLCSAAVTVDTRLTDFDKQTKNMQEKIDNYEQYEQQAGQPYHSAIQRVRNGADIEELIQQCGLSKEEAMLLIRMQSKNI
jgi:Tfp pilus assembly protein PilN